MAFMIEALLVGGVALDLVGAGVLSHAHNAESIVELREEIGEEGPPLGNQMRSRPTHGCWQRSGSASCS